MDRRKEKQKMTPGKWAVLAVVLLLAEPQLFGALLIVAAVVALIFGPLWLRTKKIRERNTAGAPPPAQKPREPAFDDCPKPVCFHRDKGEHHVRKGKELDPWDRPDIDISKYQRRQ
ncbi:MAG: hypothetical protein IJ375_05555 [Oscillospiraceae bacterium]|nr:hypothetical protein [Oscillospiraceae bacterium]